MTGSPRPTNSASNVGCVARRVIPRMSSAISGHVYLRVVVPQATGDVPRVKPHSTTVCNLGAKRCVGQKQERVVVEVQADAEIGVPKEVSGVIERLEGVAASFRQARVDDERGVLLRQLWTVRVYDVSP